MRYKDYTDLYNVDDVYLNPWKEKIIINGTDGMQFHPMVSEDETLNAFVSDFARTTHFTYRDTDLSAYSSVGPKDSIEMLNFELAQSDMQKASANPDNEKYNTLYDGTINLGTVLRAPAIGSKGHYLQLDEDLKDSVPNIVDHHFNTIEPTKDVDDTWLGIEKYSGVCIQARERIQLSFLLNGSRTDSNGLFAMFDADPLIPFVFVQRDSVMTDDQVGNILEALVLANKLRIPVLIGLVTLGTVLLVVAGCCFKRHRDLRDKRRKYEELERLNQIDERTYQDGLGNVKLQESGRSSHKFK